MYTKPLKYHFSKFLYFFGVLFALLIIHSCRKDNTNTVKAPQLDQAVAQAKTWYETAYPASNSGSGKLINQSTGGSFDLSQHIKPDWPHSQKYKRNNEDVIELPIDPGTKYNGGLRDIATNKIPYNKNYSRSYFLFLNDGKQYTAYVMTVIADDSYVKGDTSKLKNNTYQHNDADFTGLVLYFTPKGKYVQGYAYENGQPVSPSASTTQGTQKIQSLSDSQLKPQDMVQVCTDWYWQTYADGILVNEEYLYTSCISYGNNGSGGSGTAPPTPTPCAPPPPTVVNSVSGSTLTTNATHPIVNFIPPPGDCPVSNATLYIVNNLKDPCLKYVLNKLINTTLNDKIANIINDVFGSSDKVNLTFKENNDPNGAPAITALPTITSDGVYNETTTLNLAKVQGSSQEFAAIIMIHETLHAYMNYNNQYRGQQLQQHIEIAQKYVNDIRVFVKSLYPTISDPDANAIILNGLKDVYLNNPTAYQALLKNYNITDPLGTYELQRAGITGTSCSID